MGQDMCDLEAQTQSFEGSGALYGSLPAKRGEGGGDGGRGMLLATSMSVTLEPV